MHNDSTTIGSNLKAVADALRLSPQESETLAKKYSDGNFANLVTQVSKVPANLLGGVKRKLIAGGPAEALVHVQKILENLEHDTERGSRGGDNSGGR